MRTEVALAALGFVFVISLSSLLTSYDHRDSKKILLDTVTGTVAWGNFSYWKLSQQGPLLLQLVSLTGDADLFISEHERPSYETDRNNLSSATCGVDSVQVPSAFPRPIGIGVFGHWSSETSKYLMNVYLETEEIESQDLPPGVTSQSRERAPGHKRPATTDSQLLPAVLSVLDVLVEMFIV